MQNRQVETEEKAQVNDSQARVNDSQANLSREAWDGMKSGGATQNSPGRDGGSETPTKNLPHCTIDIGPERTRVTCENESQTPKSMPAKPDESFPKIPDLPKLPDDSFPKLPGEGDSFGVPLSKVERR